MGWIRIGWFDNFKGSDTLLIDADLAGLESLAELLANVGRSGQSARLDQFPDVASLRAISVVVESSPRDVGLVSASNHELIWRRSPVAWAEVVEKLQAMRKAGQPCHQYLDGPADQLQVMLTFIRYKDLGEHAVSGRGHE